MQIPRPRPICFLRIGNFGPIARLFVPTPARSQHPTPYTLQSFPMPYQSFGDASLPAKSGLNTGFGHTRTQPLPRIPGRQEATWAPRGTCAFVVGSLDSLAEWRRVRILYSAFLLAVVELDSSGVLEWIVERIEGSIPHFCWRCGCVLLGLACVMSFLPSIEAALMHACVLMLCRRRVARLPGSAVSW